MRSYERLAIITDAENVATTGWIVHSLLWFESLSLLPSGENARRLGVSFRGANVAECDVDVFLGMLKHGQEFVLYCEAPPA